MAEKAKTSILGTEPIWKEVKEMLFTRFVSKHQHLMDAVSLIHLKRRQDKGFLKVYAKEF